jgi:hypothetical protein
MMISKIAHSFSYRMRESQREGQQKIANQKCPHRKPPGDSAQDGRKNMDKETQNLGPSFESFIYSTNIYWEN